MTRSQKGERDEEKASVHLHVNTSVMSSPSVPRTGCNRARSSLTGKVSRAERWIPGSIHIDL